MKQYDLAIVGAGMLGLSHALAAARKGLNVLVLEADRQAEGASIRNFGMFLPMGMPEGDSYHRAMHSREILVPLLREIGLWSDPSGSLTVAHHDDEMQVLSEFCKRTAHGRHHCQLLNRLQILERCPSLNPEGVVGGLFSDTEITLNPRLLIPALTRYLRQQHGVDFRFGHRVTDIRLPEVQTTREVFRTSHVVVCTGAGFDSLYPDVHERHLSRCKLQMLRTAPQPDGVRLPAMMITGLSLAHYQAFAGCPSIGQLQHRLAKDYQQYLDYGIHILHAQHNDGSVLIGDSHEYDEQISPFHKAQIEQLILAGSRDVLNLPTSVLMERWTGYYAKAKTGHCFQREISPGILLVNGVGGTGMTTGLALAVDGLNDFLNG
ncbi:TIGR03364 family FAD-dependent oxidoreductase [Kistimonas asteriae]|uniref:TIGR03364 family FAD-dependent oxidoreductase n=1 Tax=Kistimonas asteriae TaxID=517724 RepID=UPI001BAA1600|nr:TIGR03364 family FAD-dependent oxidoreductase [Kistimonas asteriae]